MSLNGKPVLEGAVGAVLEISRLQHALGIQEQQLSAVQTMNQALASQVDQLRQEATVMAALHCQAGGGEFVLTEAMIAALPPMVEIELEVVEQGRRYRAVAGNVPPGTEPKAMPVVPQPQTGQAPDMLGYRVATLESQLVETTLAHQKLMVIEKELRQEVVLLAGLHCMANGGRFTVTLAQMADFPADARVEVVSNEFKERVYVLLGHTPHPTPTTVVLEPDPVPLERPEIDGDEGNQEDDG